MASNEFLFRPLMQWGIQRDDLPYAHWRGRIL